MQQQQALLQQQTEQHAAQMAGVQVPWQFSGLQFRQFSLQPPLQDPFQMVAQPWQRYKKLDRLVCESNDEVRDDLKR